MKFAELTGNAELLVKALHDDVVKNVLPFDQSNASDWEFYEMIHENYLDDYDALVSGDISVEKFIAKYHLDRCYRWMMRNLWKEYYDIIPSDLDDVVTCENQLDFIHHWSDKEIPLPDYDYEVYHAIVERVKNEAVERIEKLNWNHFLRITK